METYWAVKTNGNPIGAVQEIVLNFWEQLNLEAMIVPFEGAKNKIPKATVVLNTEFIKNLNPFKPVMSDNSAKLVTEFINKFQDKKLGVILRPCEMNTLIESSDIGGFSLLNVFTISFDCLGTLPVADYLWKLEHKLANSYRPQKFLQFSRQGGILTYRNRPACQICSKPEANCADLNINIFGLPVRKVLLIKNNGLDKTTQLNFKNLSYEKVEPALVDQHRKTTSRILERNSSTFFRIVRDLEQILPGNIDELISQFRQCGHCQTIGDICPICSLQLQKIKNIQDVPRDDLIRCLVSCSGCGMCESICPEHHSLNLIFKYIRSRMQEENSLLNNLKSKNDFLI